MAGVGLVLEGGGMRGVYTAGVLDYFLDEGIHIPSIYGVSAGACHAVSYVSRQRGRALKTIIDYVGDRRYGSFHSLLTTGDYFGVDFIYRQIPDTLVPFDYGAYLGSTSTLWAVVYNCRTGLSEYKKATDMRQHMPYIQASASLPVLSRMVTFDGSEYLDGGIADSIPIAESIHSGNTRNIIVLTQHRGFEKQPTSMLPLIRARYRKYPLLGHSLAKRHILYNSQLAHCHAEEEAGTAVIIQPSAPVTIGKLEKDKNKLRALYDQGYADAQAQSKALSQLL